MRAKDRIRLAVVAGAGVAAAYAGFTAVTWWRYGRPRARRYTTPALDRYMPEPEVIEHQSIEVDAPADLAYAACHDLDLERSAVINLIFATRARVMGGDGRRELPTGLIDEVQALGWRVLEETPGHEIVVGAACKPWQADPEFRGIESEKFAGFGDPGFAKIVWNFSVEPVSESRCIVHTETRVITTDRASRRRFRRYWALVSPGIVLIRLLGLRIVKSDAEKGVSHDNRSAFATGT